MLARRASSLRDDALLLASVALTAGAWLALRQDTRQHRPFAARKQAVMMQIALAIASRVRGVQEGIDAATGMPNLGSLVAMMAAPVAMTSNLDLYDELVGAPSGRRRWHQATSACGLGLIACCWLRGVPHDRRLPWQFGGVSLDGGDRWRAATALSSTTILCVQAVEGMLASRRAVLHLYATGQERALCLRSSLYGLAQLCLAALTAAVSVRPAGYLLGRRSWVQLPAGVAQGLLLCVALFLLMGNIAPAWRLGQAAGAARTPVELALERALRLLYVLTCYGDVRRLALALQWMLPLRPVRMDRHGTALVRLRHDADLELLLQLFKTTINDARHILSPYVDTSRYGTDAIRRPERAAEALIEAQRNKRREWLPPQELGGTNPLEDAVSFDDERFLAAVWRAYARHRMRPRVLTVANWTRTYRGNEARQCGGSNGEE